MKRPFTRLSGVLALMLATAALAGTALAGNGNENANGNSAAAPGQVKKDDAAQPQPAPQAQPAQPAVSKGSQQQTARASGAGVKPSSTTTHWTGCTTGSSAGTATCKATEGTPDTKPDVSKQYGNGKTAAQIAVSRGGTGVLLTGPGNSQPHKVTLCGKPNNPSGGVDVHAVKSYATSTCETTTQQLSVQLSATAVCGLTTLVTQSTGVGGVLHGKHLHLMTNPNSAHFTKHADAKAPGTTITSTQVIPTGESCASLPSTRLAPSTPSTSASEQAQAGPSTVVRAVQAPAVQSQSAVSAVQATSAAPAANSGAGGVLGAQATLATPKQSHGGVLGAVAGTSLPFTGFPVWAAVLAALGLIGAGALVRRHGTGPSRI
jgi:hypothetical protein